MVLIARDFLISLKKAIFITYLQQEKTTLKLAMKVTLNNIKKYLNFLELINDFKMNLS